MIVTDDSWNNHQASASTERFPAPLGDAMRDENPVDTHSRWVRQRDRQADLTLWINEDPIWVRPNVTLCAP